MLHKFDTSLDHGRRDRAHVPARHRRDGWKQAQPNIPWGTVVLFGVGISLGTALLQTKAAGWLADMIVQTSACKQATAFVHPGADVAVPDRDPPGLRQRHGARLRHDPDRHRRAAGCRDARASTSSA